ncbi:MAG TPA: mechanosensitive ion channel family protein [candidate division Zixibacteria bacterium]|nr:mechanosensitive ion channel family protein [candidate division Zixibacteria bacterium]
MPALLSERFIARLLDLSVSFGIAAVRIVLILAAAYFGLKLLRLPLRRMEALLTRAAQATETVPGAGAKRIVTLTSVLWTIIVCVVWFVATLVALGEVGVDVGPILAGAGIVGIAVGFGAQHLVRDLVSGFFLILENQIRVGDVAIINGTGGLVEAISFRTVVLRDLAGVVHVFPNGSINTLANMTKEWSGYVIDVGVGYREDTDRVIDVMQRVSEEMRADPQYGSAMLEPIEIFGVDSFGESAVTIKARLKTLPLQQFTVGREYRRRLKKAFDAEGIEIPYPHRVVHVAQAPEAVRPGAPAGRTS